MRLSIENSKYIIFGLGIGLVLLTSTISTLPALNVSAVDGLWTQDMPSFNPSARHSHSMAFDSINNRTYLFGGYVGMSEITDELLVYNSTTDSWSGTMSGTPHSPRFDASVIFAKPWNSLILYGGRDNSMTYNDTWSFDLGFTWTKLTTFGADPGNRSRHAMAYDISSFSLVMFGGVDESSNYLGDTYTFDGMYQWFLQSPMISPSSRADHSMVYDSKRDQIILFGGKDSMSYFDDVWLYNMTTNEWNPTMIGVRPQARSMQSMVYDSANDLVVMHGGWNGTDRLSDTWTYNITSSTWTELIVPGPSARYASAMVYDSDNNEIILFGGIDSIGATSDTWKLTLTETVTSSTTSATTMTTNPTQTETETIFLNATITETVTEMNGPGQKTVTETVTNTETQSIGDSSLSYPFIFGVIPIVVIIYKRKFVS